MNTSLWRPNSFAAMNDGMVEHWLRFTRIKSESQRVKVSKQCRSRARFVSTQWSIPFPLSPSHSPLHPPHYPLMMLYLAMCIKRAHKLKSCREAKKKHSFFFVVFFIFSPSLSSSSYFFSSPSQTNTNRKKNAHFKARKGKEDEEKKKKKAKQDILQHKNGNNHQKTLLGCVVLFWK